MDRRNFLKLAATLAASMSIPALPGHIEAALKSIDPKAIPKLIYLQGQSCSGCSVSLLQADSPSPLSMITEYSNLSFHSDLSATSGAQALAMIEDFISGNAGEYFLAVEGSVPYDMPEACVIGERHFEDYLLDAASTASGIVAVGTCASHGGIPAAEGNPTGALPVKKFYEKKGLSPLVINIPGCSVHPDWVWHSIIHLVKVGLPELKNGQPKLFFDRKVHETCPRYHDFQQEIFATKIGEGGCLFKLGCIGPHTLSDCSTR